MPQNKLIMWACMYYIIIQLWKKALMGLMACKEERSGYSFAPPFLTSSSFSQHTSWLCPCTERIKTYKECLQHLDDCILFSFGHYVLLLLLLFLLFSTRCALVHCYKQQKQGIWPSHARLFAHKFGEWDPIMATRDTCRDACNAKWKHAWFSLRMDFETRWH